MLYPENTQPTAQAVYSHTATMLINLQSKKASKAAKKEAEELILYVLIPLLNKIEEILI